MVADEVKVQTQESDEFVESVFEGVVNRFDDGVGFDVFGRVLAAMHMFVELEEQRAGEEDQDEVVPGGDHDLELLVEGSGGILREQEVDDAVPGLLGRPAHVQVHAQHRRSQQEQVHGELLHGRSPLE